MSIETTKARALALHAGCNWKGHQANCPRCAEFSRRGSHSTPCRQGLPLWVAHLTAEKALKLSIKLDQLPVPGQTPLF